MADTLTAVVIGGTSGIGRAIARPMPDVPPMTTAVNVSAMAAVLAFDVEEFGHGPDLEIHHRAPRLNAAANLFRRL